MRRVAVALLCATGSALVAPPTARRPSALAASATAEVPVKTFDGADSGKATLNLKVTKGEDGSILLEPASRQGSSGCPLHFMGTYTVVTHAHNHKGRPVYRRTAPLLLPLPQSRFRSMMCVVM